MLASSRCRFPASRGYLRTLLQTSLFSALLTVTVLLASPTARAQSITTGAISGVVTDPTGAAVPGAKVTVTSLSTGAVHTTASQANGGYNLPLLEPGDYTVVVAMQGFETFRQTPVAIGVSAQVGLPVKLTIGATTQTVEINGEAPLIEPQNANTTTVVTEEAIQNIPDPGNDITFFALFAPGAYITKSGTSSVSVGGGGSIGYTFEGADLNDPFNNLNVGSATNLQLGTNDIAEVSLNTNSYSVDEGRYAAAQMNFVSKTGGNNFHGNLQYQWNGRVLNAFDYFAKATPGQQPPKPDDNVNNYAASVGGPLLHNRLFFFFDNEGTYIELPTAPAATFPTQAWETYVQQELGLGGYETSKTYLSNPSGSWNPSTNPYKCLPASAPNIVNGPQPCGAQAASVNTFPFESYYSRPELFGSTRYQPGGTFVLNPAPTSGCGLLGPDQGGSATTPVVDSSYNPQVQTPGSTPSGGISTNLIPTDDGCFYSGTDFNSNFTWDSVINLRVDWTKSASDSVWARFNRTAGVQASSVSPIGPLFNTTSWQPVWDGETDWAHTFSATLTNDLSANMLFYNALFGHSDLAGVSALMPYQMSVTFPQGSLSAAIPTGRNIMQYGYIDNLTWTRGAHTIKFGVNFRRDQTNDFLASPTYSETASSFPDFYFGYATSNSKPFPVSVEEPYRSFALDMFAGDTWQLRKGLTLIFGVRATHDSNPKDLQDNLGIVSPWEDISHTLSGPIDQVVHAGQNLWATVPMAQWQPRVAVTWQPRNNLLVKAGWGQFTTIPNTSSIATLAGNTPFRPTFTGGYGAGNQGAATANTGPNGCPFSVLAVNSSVCGVLDDPAQQLSAYNAVGTANQYFQTNFFSGAPSCNFYAINPPTPTNSAGTPLCVTPNSFTVVEPAFKPAFTQQWSLSLQREFGQQFALTAAYAGNRTIDNSESFDPLAFQTACNGCFAPYNYIPVTSGNSSGLFNDLDPRFTGWTQTYYQQGQWTTFNALEITAQERVKHGISFDMNYNWAHNMTSLGNPCYQCAIPAPGHTYSGVDLRHDVNVDYTWSLPFHASGNFWGSLVNDWQISGATFLESGNAVGAPSSTLPASPFLQLGASSLSPSVLIPGVPIYAKGITFPNTPYSPGTRVDRLQWFYPGAFGNTYDSNNKSCYNPLTNQDIPYNLTCAQFGYQYGAPGQPGIETELRGPGFTWTNLFFTKMFTLREGVKLRIDGQMYNLFNHANFSAPSQVAALFQPGTASTNFVNSSMYQAGSISSTASPATGLLGASLGGKTAARMIAFQGKITF